ncbi:HNH endonuclease [Cellulomonas denverensis]|uniref:HNH endonuclease n=1 Tax=Cellulomonas denverensis TaxID=264297 RepID=UPI0019431983|nr:HNH endonuclease [Cellulomonas denverensis]
MDNVPDWRDGTLGTRVRVALWLASEVGEGGTFRKQQLRDAMPGVEQIDRRMRDLRPAGWEILTYRDRLGLEPDELLLNRIGLPVWQPEHRAAGLRVIPARVRQQVLERDSHRCVRCGVLAGEPYADDPATTARLTLGHVSPHKHGSSATASDLVTECARCNETVKHFTSARLSKEQVWDRVVDLNNRDKVRVLSWLAKGRRDATPAEIAASLVFQLPAVERDEIRDRLADAVG